MNFILPRTFYIHDDVVHLSRALLGKFLVTQFEEKTAGMIVETEAYRAPEDRASHAFGNKRTKRNAVMFEEGGVAYVYLCYGIHNLFNVVTNIEGVPHGILVRAIIPVEGISLMLKRRRKMRVDRTLATGPGAVSQALGITCSHSGHVLTDPPIWIEERGIQVPNEAILASKRVGIDYAGEDAELPWRFRIVKTGVIL